MHLIGYDANYSFCQLQVKSSQILFIQPEIANHSFPQGVLQSVQRTKPSVLEETSHVSPIRCQFSKDLNLNSTLSETFRDRYMNKATVIMHLFALLLKR